MISVCVGITWVCAKCKCCQKRILQVYSSMWHSSKLTIVHILTSLMWNPTVHYDHIRMHTPYMKARKFQIFKVGHRFPKGCANERDMASSYHNTSQQTWCCDIHPWGEHDDPRCVDFFTILMTIVRFFFCSIALVIWF